ncbi:unnamed protein product [Penicillium bialowiezense]
MAENHNQNNNEDSGPGEGPFPIPSVLGQGDEREGDALVGTPHANRIIEMIEGENGVLETLEFLKSCVNELPAKAHASSKSESDKCELEETRLDAHQALVEVENLIQHMKLAVDMAAQP